MLPEIAGERNSTISPFPLEVLDGLRAAGLATRNGAPAEEMTKVVAGG